jgi:hypothetical protein
MPNRIVREGILTSERVASLDWASEVFYRRLHSIVDDHGRHEAGEQLLRAKCYPLQTDSVRVADIARWMAACQKSGVILVYGVNGKQYLEVVDFGQQKRSASKCPDPPLLAIDSNCEQSLTNAHLGVVVSVVEGVIHPPAASDPLAGIDEQVAKDFRALRKTLKAPITPTAIAGIEREAMKAGMTLEAALRTCVERNWRGFKAEWIKGDSPQPAKQRRQL